MTKAEILEKYGNVPLSFSSYYKYSFTFRGTADDGAKIMMEYGGNSDDIYRYDVSADSPVFLNKEDYSYLSIELNGEKIFDDYVGC